MACLAQELFVYPYYGQLPFFILLFVGSVSSPLVPSSPCVVLLLYVIVCRCLSSLFIACIARHPLPRCSYCLLRAAELARLSGSSAPTTPADFERLVLASPSSSFVWIKYMALHISLGDVDAARKVAQRALDMINYR